MKMGDGFVDEMEKIAFWSLLATAARAALPYVGSAIASGVGQAAANSVTGGNQQPQQNQQPQYQQPVFDQAAPPVSGTPSAG